MKHGASAYAHSCCRCAICREAARVRMAAYVAKADERRADPSFALFHGTYSTYVNHRCRCQACTEEAQRVNAAAYLRRKREAS